MRGEEWTQFAQETREKKLGREVSVGENRGGKQSRQKEVCGRVGGAGSLQAGFFISRERQRAGVKRNATDEGEERLV